MVNESWLYSSLFHHMERQVWRLIFYASVPLQLLILVVYAILETYLSCLKLFYLQTDTASVLLEAMEYIQFLHEQVKVCPLFPSIL